MTAAIFSGSVRGSTGSFTSIASSSLETIGGAASDRVLYEDLFAQACRLGHSRIACEVNALPPNPTSDAFHAALGFVQVGTATIDGGAKIVRYLVRDEPTP